MWVNFALKEWPYYKKKQTERKVKGERQREKQSKNRSSQDVFLFLN